MQSYGFRINNIFPIVVATAVPVTIAPTTLSIAAIKTARYGERTLVETTVAIAFGASVKPLANSAQRTKNKTTAKANSHFHLFHLF